METTEIPSAIETRYAGRLFRSRLEARWAVFYDAIRIPWVYELEGFKFHNGVLYLPDFYLPSLDAYIEIKPVRPSRRECDKCGWLAAHTDKRVFLFWGMVGHQLSGGYPSGQLQEDGAYAFFPDDHPKSEGRWNPDDGYPLHGCFEDESFAWCRCTTCGKYGIEFMGRFGRICSHDPSDQRMNYECRSLTASYDLANQARFEK